MKYVEVLVMLRKSKQEKVEFIDACLFAFFVRLQAVWNGEPDKQSYARSAMR